MFHQFSYVEDADVNVGYGMIHRKNVKVQVQVRNVLKYAYFPWIITFALIEQTPYPNPTLD